jgi:hypothetical protein
MTPVLRTPRLPRPLRFEYLTPFVFLSSTSRDHPTLIALDD